MIGKPVNNTEVKENCHSTMINNSDVVETMQAYADSKHMFTGEYKLYILYVLLTLSGRDLIKVTSGKISLYQSFIYDK